MAFVQRLRDLLPDFGYQSRAASTTPVFDRSMKAQVYGGFAKLGFILLVPLLLLTLFGHPGLRVGYTWNGQKHSPVYYECRYLAFDGKHRIWPERFGDACPAIHFFPFNFERLF